MSIFDREEKKWKDLNFDNVAFGPDSRWNWGRGGHPLADGVWHISYLDKDMHEIRYEMPAAINEMLERRYKEGREDKLREIQNALGI